MKDLLYKEFRLCWHPAMFLFLLFGTFLLFPSWPFFIAFGYIVFPVNTLFFVDRANRDVFFTALLPVRKKDVVLAKVCLVAIIELLQIIVAVPFAVINNAVYLKGNMVGMNTNFAFFGLVLMMYAIFNLIFLPGFYKTAYKVGMPIILAICAAAVYVTAVDVAVVSVPVLRASLDGLGSSHMASQLPVLFAGIILFASLTLLAYRISARRFERLDL
ncbi:hypothetical protein CEB3_c34800 [Peptococcaceae bacterium CEB3]|nr:hypothetical protein CEB3_c34800 [Peptococcaceae bacterium CEB3]